MDPLSHVISSVCNPHIVFIRIQPGSVGVPETCVECRSNLVTGLNAISLLILVLRTSSRQLLTSGDDVVVSVSDQITSRGAVPVGVIHSQQFAIVREVSDRVPAQS